MRRWPVVDRVLALAARAHAQRCLRRFHAAADDATATQARILLERVRRHGDSDLGRALGLAHVRSYEDYARQVPIQSYDDHRPYIERVKRGDVQAMFGPRTRVRMFALTSGTTSEPKYIPVTDEVLAECRRSWNAFGLQALMDHPDAFLRPIVQVASRMDESRTEAGIPCGAITGLMAATQKRIVRRYYVTPTELAEIGDAQAKYYAVMRLAIPHDAAFIITASPATQLSLARAADRHREQIIRDIHDGTLWAELPIDAHVRARIAPRLRPDPTCARRLEALVAANGALLPKHYWRLSFLGNWTGGTMGLYLRDFPHYFGETPVRDVGLIASEGRMTIPIEDGTPAGVLDVTSHFYEFVPRGEYESGRPIALRSHEVEPGGEYFILLTTSSGLFRYDIGDLVRVHGFHGQAPVIEFVSKGAHIASMTGEKLTEQQVVLAMRRAAESVGLAVPVFVMAPCWAEVPYYRLHVEAPGGAARAAGWARLDAAMDAALREVNIEYASKRDSGRLGPVRMNGVPAGFFERLDARLRSRHRQGNEQFKHQYLYSTPGADGDFPVADGAADASRVDVVRSVTDAHRR